MGIEPTIQSWEPCLLPLQHTRERLHFTRFACPAPAELPRGLSTVTAHAVNVALRDLFGRRFPASVPDQACHVIDLDLAVTMVEVKKDRIRLSTVDTGMRAQVLESEASLRAGGPLGLAVAFEVGLTIPSIVFAACRRDAAPTSRVASPGLHVLGWRRPSFAFRSARTSVLAHSQAVVKTHPHHR
jgi:hypothetical protein